MGNGQWAITTEEIKLRERQIESAKELERTEKLLDKAGIGSPSKIMKVEHFRLNCEIQLLQAKQLLQTKQVKGDQSSPTSQ